MQSLKLVKRLSQQLPAFLLFRDHQSIALQSCIHLYSFRSIVSATHAHYKWFSKSYGLCLSHDALQLLTLLLRTTSMDRSVLEVVASACTQLNKCKCNCFYNDQVTLIVCSPCPLHLVVLMLTRSWSSLERVHMQPCSKEFAGNATASSSCQYSPQLVHEILGTI